MDTIAAIATAPGAGGIGVLRISGPRSLSIANALLGRTPSPRHAHLTKLSDADGALIDSGLLLAFPAPNSYTGEDVVELQAHGSVPVLARLLARVCSLGARRARPGEFTERAFRNGKLDLAQAEAVADLIAAGSDAAARAAQRSLQGEFSQRVEQLRSALVELRIHVEAAIDFPEEEIDFLGDGQIADKLLALRRTHAELLTAAQRGQRLRDGLHVVIIGPPNAGKSSLLNALAQSDRAIVTAIPGTTRDLLSETVQLDGIELTLVDTAGLRDHSEDAIELEGMRRARAEMERADLLLRVAESTADEVASGDTSHQDNLVADALQSNGASMSADPSAECIATVWIHSKIDRAGQPARKQLLADGTHHWLSAHTGEGLAELRQTLRELAGTDVAEGSFSARGRQIDALFRCGELLETGASQLAAGAGELLAEDLRRAHDALGEITGKITSDDLLGKIFAGFCIGK